MNPRTLKPRTKRAPAAVGLALAGLAAVGAALAGSRNMDRPHGWHGAGGEHGWGMRSQLAKLDLSDGQKVQIKAIFEDEHTKIAPLAASSMKARRALGEAIHAPVFDETAIRAAAAQSSGAQSDLAVERGRVASRIRAVLTPDQQKQLDAQRQQFLDRMQQRKEQHRAEEGEDSPDAEDLQ